MKREYETPEMILFLLNGCVITSSNPEGGSGSDEEDDWAPWPSN